ncbi:MAG: PHP domain-containing protein [Propionibacteriales bacterium]|nr:PHP domain-containing protein [Propionibacteriales bacterium]
MTIDLHTHSNCSDGTDTPAELVLEAAKAGLSVVALTDHDTTAGWVPAMAAAEHHDIHLIRGVELSTMNEGRGQHLLGYALDPANAGIIDLLGRGIASRDNRLAPQLKRLAELGLLITEEQVLAQAHGDAVGQPHVVSALLAAGLVTDRNEAHAMFVPGGKAFVPRDKVDIIDAIRIINAAGGVTVVAHPRGRKSNVSERRLAELQEAGLHGIEVGHIEHDDEEQAQLDAIARNLDLVRTGSSDYHGTVKPNRLGCYTTDPEQFQRLMSQAAHH